MAIITKTSEVCYLTKKVSTNEHNTILRKTSSWVLSGRRILRQAISNFS